MSATVYRLASFRRRREREAEDARKQRAEAERSARFRRLVSGDDDTPPGGFAA